MAKERQLRELLAKENATIRDEEALHELLKEGVLFTLDDMDTAKSPLKEILQTQQEKNDVLIRATTVEEVNQALNNGAQIEAKNNLGSTALHLAAFKGHTKVVEALLERNANIEAKGNNGNTALIWATYNGHTKVVEALLKRNANIEAKDQYDYTALTRAASRGYTEIVKALLDKGADIEAKNNNGDNAFDLTNNYEIKELVRNEKAKRNETNRFRKYRQLFAFESLAFTAFFITLAFVPQVMPIVLMTLMTSNFLVPAALTAAYFGIASLINHQIAGYDINVPQQHVPLSNLSLGNRVIEYAATGKYNPLRIVYNDFRSHVDEIKQQGIHY